MFLHLSVIQLTGGRAWLLPGRGVCVVAPRGRGACVARGVCVVKGACVAKGGVHGERGDVRGMHPPPP